MKIYIIEKQLTDIDKLSKTEIDFDNTPKLLKKLIEELVKFEIKRNEEYVLKYEVKDEKALETLKKLGKIGGVVDSENYEKPKLEEEVEKALIAFKHKRYHIFINGKQYNDLEANIKLEEGSEILINYLVGFF